MTQLLVFDWDGTLIDSADRIVYAMQTAFEDCGLVPPRRADVRGVIGLALSVAVQRLAPTGSATADIAALTDAYRRAYVAADAVPETLFEGVPDMLDGALERDCTLAIATGKSRRGLDRALHATGLAGCFAFTITADECEPKPHPAMLRIVLDKFGIAPDAALMIGDAVYDLEMAGRAGVPAAAALYGACDERALLDFEPVFALQSPARLLPALDDYVLASANPV